jgi:hypothetical protein
MVGGMWFGDTILNRLAQSPGSCRSHAGCAQVPAFVPIARLAKAGRKKQALGAAGKSAIAGKERSEWHRAVIVNEPSAAFGR